MGIRVGRADNEKHNMRAFGRLRRPSGFTLLELLFAVLVAAIVIGIGSPAFSDFRRNARMTRDANDFLTAVQQARSESAKRQTPVSLCAAEPGADEPACSGEALTTVGASGWLLFADPDGNCERAPGEAEPVLAVRPGSETLRVAANSARTCISFAANGFLRSDGGPREVYEVLFCDGVDPRPGGYRAFTLSPSGHARVTRDREEIAGTGLECPDA